MVNVMLSFNYKVIFESTNRVRYKQTGLIQDSTWSKDRLNCPFWRTKIFIYLILAQISYHFRHCILILLNDIANIFNYWLI